MGQTHYILIGGGIAGMMLAAKIVLEGSRVTLFDSGSPHSASGNAAGMFNPITGKNHLQTWRAEQLLGALEAFFETPEFQPLSKYLYKLPIYKPFNSVSEYNHGLGVRANTPELLCIEEQPLMESVFHNPIGGLKIGRSGWLDIPAFLKALRGILETHFHFRYEAARILPEHIYLSQQKIIWDSETFFFDGLVLCQGAEQALKLLWDLPVIPNKGQGIKIEGEFEIPFILSSGIYILPLGKNRFNVGATYEWEFSHPFPDSVGLKILTEALDSVLAAPYRIIDHYAGIRPTTRDRRPLVGTHPVHRCLHVFSGFGTKGVLLSAYFSAVLWDYISGKNTFLEKEYDILRFYHKEIIPLPEGANMRSIIRLMAP